MKLRNIVLGITLLVISGSSYAQSIEGMTRKTQDQQYKQVPETDTLLNAMQGDPANAFKATPSETCTQWEGTGIQFRWCETDWGLRTHQFYNGYSFPVHFYFYLEYTDGTNSGNNGNINLNSEETSDKGSNDNSSGVNKKVQAWRISKKERKDASGRWVQF